MLRLNIADVPIESNVKILQEEGTTIINQIASCLAMKKYNS